MREGLLSACVACACRRHRRRRRIFDLLGCASEGRGCVRRAVLHIQARQALPPGARRCRSGWRLRPASGAAAGLGHGLARVAAPAAGGMVHGGWRHLARARRGVVGHGAQTALARVRGILAAGHGVAGAGWQVDGSGACRLSHRVGGGLPPVIARCCRGKLGCTSVDGCRSRVGPHALGEHGGGNSAGVGSQSKRRHLVVPRACGSGGPIGGAVRAPRRPECQKYVQWRHRSARCSAEGSRKIRRGPPLCSRRPLCRGRTRHAAFTSGRERRCGGVAVRSRRRTQCRGRERPHSAAPRCVHGQDRGGCCSLGEEGTGRCADHRAGDAAPPREGRGRRGGRQAPA
mmetsp:Transcript_76365/g.214898  ORF Transcript_76365/g.214898 Transcript_76365/m.214898 type:complete len:344 (-) Transcript_76365:157-1188(-)